MYNELSEQMNLYELRELRLATKGEFNLAARILNMLWIHFSNDQEANCLTVDDKAIERFKVWLRTGNQDDAWS